MFFVLIILVSLLMFFWLWGDYTKILIFIEVLRVVFISVVILIFKIDLISLNYFFCCLVFLVCESSIGFLMFIFYVRIEFEVVKKIILVQF